MTTASHLVSRFGESEVNAIVHQPFYSVIENCLYIDANVVKRFRHSSPNQQLLLVAFEEAAWRFQIHDPLPIVTGQVPRERIANAVKRLNRSQKGELTIHFSLADGGSAIRWQLRHRNTAIPFPAPKRT